MTVDPSTFAAVFIALFVGHQVGDHWIQTQHQADCKSQPGWDGRWACAKHCTTYGATQLAAIGTLVMLLDLTISPVALVAGMAINLGTHYVADRRTPLRRLADWLGKSPGWLDHGGGMYALDQSWHYGFLFLSALVVAA